MRAVDVEGSGIEFYFRFSKTVGVGRHISVNLATSYRLDDPGIELAPIQTGRWTHPGSCTIGYRVIPGGTAVSVALTTQSI